MNKTITVKGIGKASASPDSVVITIELESIDINYERAMATASDSIDLLTAALVNAGFEKESIKTTDFDVITKYDNRKQRDGNYEKVFLGFAVTHSLKLQFDFDTAILSKAISAISKSSTNPKFSIRFTIKDDTAIKEEMLKNAANNAFRNAEILCKSSGKELGELLGINYSWGEINLYSRTQYSKSADFCCFDSIPSIDFTPDNIDVSDTVTFVWGIE